MPLAQQPKDIESNVPRENEVNILRPRYNIITDEFLGIEYCIALITVRNDVDEQLFDYGCNKDNSKLMFSTKKLKIPSSFKSTIFGQHRMRYEWGAFEAQEFPKLYFYLLSTVDRNEKINQYLTSVNLKPFHIGLEVFGESFNPADSSFFDCNAIVSYMKRVAE